MKRIFLYLILSLLSVPLWAAGTLNYLDVNQGVVYFATDESKTATSPACVDAAQADKWALSLDTDNGRAMYSMLMTAMASKNAIGIETAGDCADSTGFERPVRVWFELAVGELEPSPVVETISVYKPVAFASQRTYCELNSTLADVNNQAYMYTSSSGNSCRCLTPSRLVTIGYDGNAKRHYYQCILEVKIPVVSS